MALACCQEQTRNQSSTGQASPPLPEIKKVPRMRVVPALTVCLTVGRIVHFSSLENTSKNYNTSLTIQ